jgi:hypothetical protein
MSQQATQKPPDEFVATTGGGEATSAEAMLIAAYMILWVILMVFVGATWRRQRAASNRLEQIERAMKTGDD